MTDTRDLIAIVGMACRVPGADTPEQLWDLSLKGVSAIQHIDDSSLLELGVTISQIRDPNHVPAVGMVNDLEGFDHTFFGVSSRDAAIMDPQHRHFLELAWESLENAGVLPSDAEQAVGVFAGCGVNTYLIENVLTNRDLVDQLGWFFIRHLNNDKDFLATSVSYQLGLTGPSVSVQTACSTSLVAVHLAVQSLIGYECDVALAGGVTIDPTQLRGYEYREGEILAPDGTCRPFDAESAGTVLTSGAGAVTLKRYHDALADGDTIRAVIRASALNNDGRRKVGYLAPSTDGQADVVAEALALADIDVRTVGYIEAHGTGTRVGDPIEVAALTQAYAHPSAASWCRIGSAKAAIGHLDTAAGVVGLIKTVKALEAATLPPLANFSSPNPLLDLEASPFTLSPTADDWHRPVIDGTLQPRRAAVSSLGVGGTNAHVIVEEAPTPTPIEPSGDLWHILPVSAATPEGLEGQARRLRSFLEDHPTTDIADVAYTLQDRRSALSSRRVVVARDPREAASLLAEPDRGAQPEAGASIAFVFSGGGAHVPGMAARLTRTEPTVRAVVERALAHLGGRISDAVRTLLLDPDAVELGRFEQMSVGLPATVILETAIARLLIELGVRPAAVAGHSLGEYVAAHIAGVIGFEDMLDLVLARSELMDRSAGNGQLLSVGLGEADVESYLNEQTWVALINAIDQIAVSGTVAGIAQLREALDAAGVFNRRVPLASAPHCPLLDPILDEFRRACASITFRRPELPFIANVSGTWHAPDQPVDVEYWVDHLRQPVRFSGGLTTLTTAGITTVLEVGPGESVTAMASLHPGVTTAIATMPKDRPLEQADASLKAAIGRVWAAGGTVDWAAARRGRRGRVLQLPTYAFDHSPAWLEPGDGAREWGSADTVSAQRTADIADWSYTRSWRTVAGASGDSSWDTTVVVGPDGFAESMGVQDATLVFDATATGAPERSALSFDTTDAANWTELLTRLSSDLAHGGTIRVVHALLLDPTTLGRDQDSVGAAHRSGFQSLVAIGRAAADLTVNVHLDVVTLDHDANPGHALSIGPVLVLPEEMDNVTTRLIELMGTEADEWSSTLGAELAAGSDVPIVRLHGDNRMVPVWDPIRSEDLALEPGATLIVVGGTGGVGRALAQHAAAQLGARLGIIGRSASGAGADGVSSDLLECGATEVVCAAADVTDPDSLRHAMGRIISAIGEPDVVLVTAGLIDDAPLILKDDDRLLSVVDSKLKAAQNVEAALRGHSVGKVVLFSSVSSSIGLPGQIDYAAANAFLGAWAAHSTMPTVAIDWGVWQQVGMAARLESRELVHLAAGPHLQRWGVTDQGFEARGVLDPASTWVLDEHRLRSNDLAVMPGTGLLDLIVEALRLRGHALTGVHHASDGLIGLEHLDLVAPLTAADPVEVRVMLDNREIRVESRPVLVASEWMLHAVGRLAAQAWGERPVIDVPQDLEEQSLVDRLARHVHLGRRWTTRQRLIRRSDGCVGRVKIDDTTQHHIHPAAVDLGVAAGIDGIGASAGFWVPVSFRDVVIQGRINPESATFGTSVLSHAGSQASMRLDVVSATGWMSIGELGVTMLDRSSDLSAALPEPILGPTYLDRIGPVSIRPWEGWEAIRRMSALSESRVLVSPVDPAVLPWAIDGPRTNDNPSATISEDGAVAGRDAYEDALVSIWSELLGTPVPIDRDLFDLGANSLLTIRAFSKIKRTFDVDLPLSAMLTSPTVADQADLIRPDDFPAPTSSPADPAATGGPTESSTPGASASDEVADQAPPAPAKRIRAALPPDLECVVPIRLGGQAPPLFIVHGAGGGVLGFREVAKWIDSSIPVYGIQARGFDGTIDEDRLDRDIPTMAAVYLEEVRRVHPTGPYRLSGYSGGGLIAYDMARTLSADGQEVPFLGFLDTFCTSRRARLGRTVLRFRQNPLQAIHEQTGIFARFGFENPLHLEATRAVTEHEARLGYTHETTERAQPFFRAFREAMANFEVNPYGGDVVLYRAMHDFLEIRDPYDLGWGPYIGGTLEIVTIPGNHVTILAGDNARLLGNYLNAALHRA